MTFAHTYDMLLVCKKVGDGLSPRTGRPKAENPVNIRFSVCLDADMTQELERYCAENGITKGEAVRRGLKLLWKKKKRNSPPP